MRIMQDKRGISNVVVFVLGLVIIVVIVSNVFLWNYEMNQLDWQKMQENVEITNVSRVTSSSWYVAQSEYTVNMGRRVSGNYTNTQTADGSHETFREGVSTQQETLRPNATGQYAQWSVAVPSGSAHWSLCDEPIPDDDTTYVENADATMLLYTNADDGTQTDWTRVGTSPHLNAIDYNANYVFVSGNNRLVGDFGFADSGKSAETINSVTVQLYAKQTLGSKNLEVFLWDGSSWASLGAQTTPTSWGWMNWTATARLDTWAKIDAAEIYSKSASAAGTYEVDCARLQVNYTATDSEKDSYNLQNPTGSGTINWIRVYVRARLTILGSNVIRTLIRTHGTDYESGPLPLSTSYHSNHTQYNTNPFTTSAWTWTEIAALEAGASCQRSGGANIRMTAVWVAVNYSSTDYSLDMNNIFTLDLSTYPQDYIQSVEVQLRYRANDTAENWYLKAYNWSSSTYGDSGFSSTTGHTPTTGWDYYTVNLTDRWSSYVQNNGTVYMKLVDEGLDSNQTAIDIDFLGVRAVIDGTCFTFQNTGALTSRLVSIWVINSTLHQRYNIDFIINSAQTLNDTRLDIPLPNEQYVVKVITERGNKATYSGT